MKEQTRRFILDLLGRHNIMVLATVRPDGWPQATTVAYAHDGLRLYFACDPQGQKVANIRLCDKVSAAIGQDTPDWNQIRGLSLGGRARILTDPEARTRAQALLERKFPQWAEMPQPEDPALIAFVEVTPQVISVVDYTRGFGYSELITLENP